MFNLTSFLNKAHCELKFSFEMINFLYRCVNKALKKKYLRAVQYNKNFKQLAKKCTLEQLNIQRK